MSAAAISGPVQPHRGFMSFMGRHLVVLGGVAERYEKGKLVKTDSFAFSGWILRLHDQYFWVTAGHCLKSLDNGIIDGSLKVFDCGFADYFGDQATYPVSIPFTYEVGCGCAIDDDELGIDVGVIPLNYLTVKNLIANGVKAIGRENWIHQAKLTFDHYKMLGVPTHLKQFSLSSDGTASGGVQPVMIAVDPLDLASIPDPLPGEWFVGKLAEEATIPSIAGMSGGPIYGFRKLDTGQWTYHVVAIQSRWREKERIIFGCPVSDFAESLHKAMEAAMKAVEQSDTSESFEE